MCVFEGFSMFFLCLCVNEGVRLARYGLLFFKAWALCLWFQGVCVFCVFVVIVMERKELCSRRFS
jgi:hypothetical protein